MLLIISTLPIYSNSQTENAAAVSEAPTASLRVTQIPHTFKNAVTRHEFVV